MSARRAFRSQQPQVLINEALLRFPQLRAVFPDGKVEILPSREALSRARDMGLDLILVAPNAEPPVAKAMDYGKWQYEQNKKQAEARKKQQIIQVKELKFSPDVGKHDYEFKKNHAIRFLKDGNRVKAVVLFRGREITHPELGRDLLLKLAEDVQEVGQPEGEPRLEGRTMVLVLTPLKKKS